MCSRDVGVDVSAMQAIAERSHFASAISDIVKPEMMPCGVEAASKHVVDFTTATPDEFDNIKVGRKFSTSNPYAFSTACTRAGPGKSIAVLLVGIGDARASTLGARAC